MSFQTEDALWIQILDCLEEMLEPQVCENWFSHVSFSGYDGKRLTLSVPNEFFLSWLREHYGEALDTAVRQVFQKEVAVDFSIQPDDNLKSEEQKNMMKL
ncbi:MAG TPA: DnaA N-terminal domain-containing protein [Candidatus Hydrogenedens sp.]|nr:DnaA N-terminal domain-containing protein [Candidatus Hydrogenedens sp.]